MADYTDNARTDDGIKHGIDGNPNHDAEKGAAGGAVGGAVVGALAGGPVGAVIGAIAGGPVGAVIGAIAGGVASGAGVAAVDKVDNDNTVSGLGHGVNTDDARESRPSNVVTVTPGDTDSRTL